MLNRRDLVMFAKSAVCAPWSAGEVNAENRNQIQAEENRQFQLLLPQKQDEEEFVLRNALQQCMMQKEKLRPGLDRNCSENGQSADKSAQEKALLKNDYNSRNGYEEQPGIVKAMIDRYQRECRQGSERK